MLVLLQIEVEKYYVEFQIYKSFCQYLFLFFPRRPNYLCMYGHALDHTEKLGLGKNKMIALKFNNYQVRGEKDLRNVGAVSSG